MVRIPVNNFESDAPQTADANPQSGETPQREDAPESAAGDAGGQGGKPSDEVKPPEPAAAEAEKFKKQAEEYLDTLRRVQADFENYRKRVKKEKAETIVYATEGIIKKLLSVSDNLDRGIACSEGAAVCEDNLLDGIRLVRKQFLDVLSEYGAEPFEAAGKPFDPTLHECLYVLERADLPDGTVIEDLERGFKMHERVLRAAKVSVSRKPPEEPGGCPCEAPEGGGDA